MRRPILRFAALLGLFTVVPGCRDILGPGELTGSFPAASVNGNRLPAVVFPSANLTLYSGELIVSSPDSLALVLRIGSSPETAHSDTLRAAYSASGDTLHVESGSQRSAFTRITGPIVAEGGRILVPAEQQRSLIGGFVTAPLDLTFSR